MKVRQTSKTLEELQDKIKDPKARRKIVEEAKLDLRILELINEEAICETFHKLPSEVREMDIFDYDVYCAILQGRQEVIKNKP